MWRLLPRISRWHLQQWQVSDKDHLSQVPCGLWSASVWSGTGAAPECVICNYIILHTMYFISWKNMQHELFKICLNCYAYAGMWYSADTHLGSLPLHWLPWLWSPKVPHLPDPHALPCQGCQGLWCSYLVALQVRLICGSLSHTSLPTSLLHHIIQCWCGKDRDLHCSGHHSGPDEGWEDSGHQRNNGEDEGEENVHDSDSGRCDILRMRLYNAYIIVSSVLSDHYVYDSVGLKGLK